MLSLLGIVLGLLLFMTLAYRGYNLILAAVGGSSLMFLLSGVGILDGMNQYYLPGMVSFLERYFFLFFLSALLGKLMSDGGCAKRIALSLAAVIRKSHGNQQFFCVLLVPVLYFILCYVGISGFVVVFTVLPIAKDLFEETDTPWRLYCCAGAQTINAAYLAGSLQAGNVYATDVCGTSTTAGWQLSLAAVAVFWGVTLVLLWFTVKRVQEKEERFLPSGAAIRGVSLDEGMPEARLPALGPSLLPLAAVLLLSAVFQINVVPALFAGCMLSIGCGRKNLVPRLKECLESGISSVYGPVLSVASTYALGCVIKDLDGFSYFEALLARLPHLLHGTALGLSMAFIMASVAAPIPAFGAQMLEQYLQAGLSASTAHRMMLLTSFTSIAPHNAGIPNAAVVLRLPYGECLRMYLLFTYIPGVCALAAAVVCIKIGMIV